MGHPCRSDRSGDPEAAHQQWEQVADALREKFPKLTDMMDASREDVLAYMAFPMDHWAQIASTNPPEKNLDGAKVARRPVDSLSPKVRLSVWVHGLPYISGQRRV
jgi:transposase-like protein